MSLETELKNALRRVPVPEGFADRVLARVSRPERPAAISSPWRAIAATLLLAMVLGGWGAREVVERRREGERARKQVLLALRIAGTKVARAQREVREIGSHHIAR